MRMVFDAQISRLMREQFKTCARSRKRNSDEGALLVEVLVGMLILVIVFTATTISLSNMAEQRVRVEQRDRALKIASEYDELTRVFKCGFIVDKVQDSLAAQPFTGIQDYTNQVGSCDFGLTGNAGDQNFVKEENINENGTLQRFNVSIRYWWEWPGSNNRHLLPCTTIRSGIKELPLILVRGIRVSWTEKGQTKEIGIVKRDPAPNNSVVFASGNRVSILANNSVIGNNVLFAPYGTAAPPIRRISDSIFAGQPTRCSVFAYVTPDGTTREITQSALPDPTINGLTLEAQDFVLVNS